MWIPHEVDLTLDEELLGDGFELLAEAEEVGILRRRDATLSFRHPVPFPAPGTAAAGIL